MVIYIITVFCFLNASVYMVIIICCLNDIISLNNVLFVTGVIVDTWSVCLGRLSAEMIVCRVNPRGRWILTRISEVYRRITRSSFCRIWCYTSMVIFIVILLRCVCWGFGVTYTSSEAVFVRAVIFWVNPGLANFSCYSFPWKIKIS